MQLLTAYKQTLAAWLAGQTGYAWNYDGTFSPEPVGKVRIYRVTPHPIDKQGMRISQRIEPKILQLELKVFLGGEGEDGTEDLVSEQLSIVHNALRSLPEDGLELTHPDYPYQTALKSLEFVEARSQVKQIAEGRQEISGDRRYAGEASLFYTVVVDQV